MGSRVPEQMAQGPFPPLLRQVVSLPWIQLLLISVRLEHPGIELCSEPSGDSELNNHQAHGHGAADSLTLLVISALAASRAVAHTGTLCVL